MIKNVTNPLRDRILIVENDPVISDLIARQALQAAGYQTFIVGDASMAIGRIVQLVPDVIIANANLPGLSGRDLVVALSTQGLEIPVIMVAKKGMESEIMQAFRVGVTDFLLMPAREPEIVNVVERVLGRVHERREREKLQRQLQQINQELQLRVRELTTIFSIGKAVTSITDSTLLFDRILEGAIKVTQADLGWFLLREEGRKVFRLVAQRGLPASLSDRINQPWDDGISSLVALSGESLAIHGEPLKRFKITSLGQSALIIPVKVQKQAIGLLVIMRKGAIIFNSSEQHLLEALADYASISLVNAQLFRTVEERARQMEILALNAQSGEKINNEILTTVKEEMRVTGETAGAALERLVKDPTARWNPTQRQALTVIQEQLKNIGRVAEAISPQVLQAPAPRAPVNLTELSRQAASRFQHFALQNDLTLVADIAVDSLMVQADPGQLIQVLHGLLSNAIKFSIPGGQVTLRVERTASENMAHVSVSDGGVGIASSEVSHIFDLNYRSQESRPRRFGGLGIGLSLVRELITNQQGKIWVESRTGQGSKFHFTLPLAKTNQ